MPPQSMITRPSQPVAVRTNPGQIRKPTLGNRSACGDIEFDDKYPDAQPGIPSRPNIVKSLDENQQRLCIVCEEPTRWFHRELLYHVGCDDCIDRFLEQN